MDAETFQQNIISFLIMLLFIPVTATRPVKAAHGNY